MALNAATRPGYVGTPVDSWVLDDTVQLRRLRAALHAALTGETMPDGGSLDAIPEKIALVATELATNALRHAHPPTRVCLYRTDYAFMLEVIDHDINDTPVPAPASTAPGGWGLHIADDLAGELGWYVDGNLKHVWAHFPIPADNTGGA
jgi:serine/threonine-protein kinase RsbW